MSRQMCWLSSVGADGTKILHLRLGAHDPWKPYTAFQEYSAPDYPVPGGSKGWATYQKLLKAGWTLVASSQGNQAQKLAAGVY